MTFLEVAQEWMETHKGAISYSTQVNYKCCINLLSTIHQLSFQDIKYANLQKVINDKNAEGYSKSQLHKLKVVITQIYRHALIQEYTEKILHCCSLCPAIQNIIAEMLFRKTLSRSFWLLNMSISFIF